MRLASHSPFEASIMGKQIVTSCLPDWYRMCQPGLARLCLHEFRSKGVRIGRKEVVGLDGEAERRVAAILSSRSFEPHSTWHPQSTSHLLTGSSDPTQGAPSSVSPAHSPCGTGTEYLKWNSIKETTVGKG